MGLKPKNWDKFQHYKDRRPPWIKLHHGLVDDKKFFSLKGEDGKFLILIWLIASEENGNLPPLAELAFRLRINEKQCSQLVSRLHAWLEQNDSEMLAKPEQVATPEKEGEAEERQSQRESGASAPRPLPKSPGAQGEFMLVTWLCEELRIALMPAQRAAAVKHIGFTAGDTGLEDEELGSYILARAKEAQARGEPMDAWYLADGKWRVQAEKAGVSTEGWE